MKNFRIWLPLMAALAVAAPLRAAENTSPVADPDAAAAVTASVLPAAAQKADQEMGHSAAQNGAAQNQVPGQSALPDAPEVKPGVEPGDPAELEKSLADQKSHPPLNVLVPTYGVVNGAATVSPLTPAQKFKLFCRWEVDPFHFFYIAVAAGLGQATDNIPEYGQGAEGYGKRYATTFANSTLTGFFGKFALASALHEDPRYFRQGTGSAKSRLIHAAKFAVITRKDDGSSTINYANIFSGFIAAGIGQAYYPDEERDVGSTLSRGARHIPTSAIGPVLAEFWPDIRDRLHKKKK